MCNRGGGPLDIRPPIGQALAIPGEQDVEDTAGPIALVGVRK
jgi:hypothetical protein